MSAKFIENITKNIVNKIVCNSVKWIGLNACADTVPLILPIVCTKSATIWAKFCGTMSTSTGLKYELIVVKLNKNKLSKCIWLRIFRVKNLFCVLNRSIFLLIPNFFENGQVFTLSIDLTGKMFKDKNPMNFSVQLCAFIIIVKWIFYHHTSLSDEWIFLFRFSNNLFHLEKYTQMLSLTFRWHMMQYIGRFYIVLYVINVDCCATYWLVS